MADDELRSDLANTTDPAKGATLVAYNDHQTVREHLQDIVTFEQFGGGKNNDDASLDRLISWLNGRGTGCTVRFDGTYTFTRPCAVTLICPGVMLCGRGTLNLSWEVTSPDTTEFLLNAQGPGWTGAETTLTADWTHTHPAVVDGNGVQITVASTAGFLVGDYVAITSKEYYGGTGLDGFRVVGKGRLRRIRNVIDATHLALDEGPNDTFDATNCTVNVRGLRLLEGLAVHDLRIVGPSGDISFGAEDIGGASFLNGLHVHRYVESGLYAINFQAPVTQFQMCDSVTNRDCVYKNCSSGNRVFSVRHPTYWNLDFEGGRRPQDWDSQYRPFAGRPPSTGEEVQTEHVLVVGGFARNAASGCGGHIAHGVTVIGLVVRDTNVGIHQRGKHLTVLGCDIQARQSGIILGRGSSSMHDISTYCQITDSGHIHVDAATRLVAGVYAGIYATSGWQSLRCDAYIEAPNAIMPFGKYQSNVHITANFKGTNPNPTYGGYCFGLGDNPVIAANNIRVQGGTIENTNRGVWIRATQETIRGNIQVDNVHFKDVNTYFVRAETQGLDQTCHVQNCSHSGTFSAFVSPVRPSGGTALWQSGNTWGVSGFSYTLTDGALEVMSRADIVAANVSLTANATVTSITGGKTGQIVVLGKDNTVHTLSIASNTAIRLSAPVSLSNAYDSVTLMCINTAGTVWKETGRAIAN